MGAEGVAANEKSRAVQFLAVALVLHDIQLIVKNVLLRWIDPLAKWNSSLRRAGVQIRDDYFPRAAEPPFIGDQVFGRSVIDGVHRQQTPGSLVKCILVRHVENFAEECAD